MDAYRFARNVSDAEDGFLREKRYLLMDRDTKFSEAFRVILEQTGVKVVRLPPRSPNLKSKLRTLHAIRQGGMPRCMIFSERDHYGTPWADFLGALSSREKPSGLNNQLLSRATKWVVPPGDVACRERLGGMLRYYYRQAA